jgi:hypothetical protein
MYDYINIKICNDINKLDYIDPNINVKLYDYINYVKIIVKFYIAKVYINVVYRRLRQDSPPL